MGRDALNGKIYSSHSADHEVVIWGWVLPGETPDRRQSEEWDFNGTEIFYHRVEIVPSPAGNEESTEIDLGRITAEPGRYRFRVSLDGDEPVEHRTYWSSPTGPDTLLVDIGTDGTLHVGFLIV